MPEVTVLMTVYNGMPYLPLAIESILKQTWTDFEFLIINDCSTDNSRDVIQSYDDPRIRLLDNEENLNQTKSLNRGLEHTRTELVARMDADDISHPKRLEMQVEYLHSHPQVVVAGTNVRLISNTGRVIGKRIRPEHDVALRWLQLFSCSISGGSAMFRNNIVWSQLGGFVTSLRFSQDWELWSRIPIEYRLATVPALLLDVRLHSGSSSILSQRAIDREWKRVSRANVRRILRATCTSDGWIDKVDTLIAGRADHPEHLLQIVERLFDCFCSLYPNAKKDPEVLEELARQYLRVLEHIGTRSIPTVARAMRLAWPLCSRRFYITRLVRSLAIRAGARQIRRWIRSVFGYPDYR